MKIRLLFLSFLLMPILVFAQHIDEKSASEIAALALKKNMAKGGIKKIPSADKQGRYEILDPHLELHRVVRDFDGKEPCFYIYNQKGGDGGFAIVSNQGQLLAHSDRGAVDYDKVPDNLRWLLEQYRKFLSEKYYEPYPSEDPADKVDGSPSLYRRSIEPMVGSEWSQDSPFSNLIREKYEASGATAEEIVAGCTTIAMAQTMFFWKHPQNGTGTKKFKLGKTSYTVDFGETIDWDHIGPSPYWKPSTNEALADLSYKVAASLDSKVEDGSTSAYANDVPKALTTYFDYDAAVRDESSIFFSGEVYEDMAYSELENGRPCIIYGQDGWVPLISAGHTMMVEGYDAETNHFYINMGWGAFPEEYVPANAYYALTVKNGYHKYVVFQHIITHIYPNSGGSAKPQIYAHTYTPANQVKPQRTIRYNKAEGSRNYHVSAQIFSNDMDASIVTGMMAKDFVTGQECVFEGPALNLSQGFLKNMDFDFDLDKIPYNGYYQLYPVFRMADDDEWLTIWIQPENEEDVFQPTYVDVTNTDVLDLGKEVNFVLERNTMEPEMTLQIDYKLPIKGVPVTFTSSDPSVISVDGNGLITAHRTGEVTITAHCDDYTFNGNRLVRETTKKFQIICMETKTDHKAELVYFFPYFLENDEVIHIKNNIWLTPAYANPGFSVEIEYVLGFFQNGKLVKKGYSWQGQYLAWNRVCQYMSLEYLDWHQDLTDGEYELRLLYRIPGETPEGEFWVMPTHRDGEARVFMKLENGHASFTQSNRHPCELRVDGIHMSKAVEVGMQNSITVDVTRTTEPDYNDRSDLFFYVDGKYEGHEELDMQSRTSASYQVNDFGYTYYFTPDHAGLYNMMIVDGRNHVLYEKNMEVGEAKNYQLRVNKVIFHNSSVPNTANNKVQIELEIENIGEYRYTGDVICRPVPNSGTEETFWPPRFQLDIAPGEVVSQILPMDFDFYFSLDDTEYIIIKCYYTSNGKDTILWESDKLTYIDANISLRKGDSNGDGEVNITDVLVIVDYILGRSINSFVFSNADLDNNGEINITDALIVVDFILGRTPTHFPPSARMEHGLIRMDTSESGCLIHTDTGSVGLTALQMDVVLPGNSTMRPATLTGKASKTHHIMTRQLDDNRYRIVVFSTQKSPLESDAPILNFDIEGQGGVVFAECIQCYNDLNIPIISPDLSTVVTGISAIHADSHDNAPVYTISGQRISKPQRGITISNNRKVVVR